MTDETPLRHADIGETETLETQTEVNLTFVEPDLWYYEDLLLGDQELTDVDVRENEYGEKRVVLTWEREATKALGSEWDKKPLPQSTKDPNHKTPIGGWKRALAEIGIPIGVTGIIAWFVLSRVNGAMADMTVNGEPLGHVDPVGIFVSLFLIFAIAALIVWGLKGGLSGMAGIHQR